MSWTTWGWQEQLLLLVVSSWRVRTKVMVRVAGKYGLAKHKASIFNLHLTQHCM